MLHKKLGWLFIACILLAGCGNTTSENIVDRIDEIPEIAAIPNEGKVSVQVGDITKKIYYQGTVVPEDVELGFPQDGLFKKYEVTLGDTVTKGQILATSYNDDIKDQIDDLNEQMEDEKRTYKIDVKKVKNQIQLLQFKANEQTSDEVLKLSRNLELSKQEIILRQTNDMYQLKHEIEMAQLNELKEKLNANVIVAPKDGVIVYEKELDSGMEVSNGQKYLAIADPNVYKVTLNGYISQVTMNRMVRSYIMKDDKTYEIEYESMPIEVYSKLRSNAEQPYSTFKILNHDDDLQLGDFVMGVLVSKEKKKVLILPNTALNSDTLGCFVYLNEQGMKTKRYIKTGITDDINTEIKEGLVEGDEVYVAN